MSAEPPAAATAPRPRVRLKSRLLLASAAALAAAALAAGLAVDLEARPWPTALAAFAAGLAALLPAVSVALRPYARGLRRLQQGVRSLQADDFSLQLDAGPAADLGELFEVYNRLADAMRRERGDLRQRQLLLQTVLETSPAAVLLANAVDRVLFANRAARVLFFAGRRLEGHELAELLAACPPPLAEALTHGRDSLVSIPLHGVEETFHVTRREMQLNARRHTLLMVRHVTPELRRQEVAVWKKVIRVIGHELKNSLAPIRSLVGSARLIAAGEGPPERLEEVFATIDDCAARLHRFVEGYSRFARLPEPRREAIALGPFLDGVRQLEPFRIDGEVPAATLQADPGQLRQVLVNLIKNARESGGPADEVALSADLLPEGTTVLRILDRGSGMDAATLSQALLPFYTSKPHGSGLGLPLCREILEAHGGSLHLANRPGGGMVVTCRLPG